MCATNLAHTFSFFLNRFFNGPEIVLKENKIV